MACNCFGTWYIALLMILKENEHFQKEMYLCVLLSWGNISCSLVAISFLMHTSHHRRPTIIIPAWSQDNSSAKIYHQSQGILLKFVSSNIILFFSTPSTTLNLACKLIVLRFELGVLHLSCTPCIHSICSKLKREKLEQSGTLFSLVRI